MEIFPILQSGSTTTRSCTVLSPAVLVSLIFTLFTAVVHAGEYKLIKEDDLGWVCAAYEKNLTRISHLPYGIACRRELDENPGFTRPTWKKFHILKATASLDNRTLEYSLDALRTLVANYLAGTPATNVAPTPIDNRDAFYTNLYQLQADLEGLPFYNAATDSLGLTVSAASLDAAALAALAHTDLATRYALYKLNPFVVGGAGLYASINANGALDLYDTDTHQGSLSDEYLTDRAVFLVNRLLSGTNNSNTFSGDPVSYRIGSPQVFEDLAGNTPTRLYLGEDNDVSAIPLTGMTRIVFGGEGNDTGIVGGEKWDKVSVILEAA
jgi:hypothetical protein